MALSGSTTSTLIQAGTSLVGEAVFGRGAREAQKDAAKAQSRLAAAQLEEQNLRNRILAQSIQAQDGTLPYAVSLPGRSYGAQAVGNAKNPVSSTAPTLEAGFSSPIVMLLIAGVALFFLVKG